MALIQERSSPFSLNFNRFGLPVQMLQQALTGSASTTLTLNSTKGRRLIISVSAACGLVFSFGFGANAATPTVPTGAQTGVFGRRWSTGEGPIEFVFDHDVTDVRIYSDAAVTALWTLFPN